MEYRANSMNVVIAPEVVELLERMAAKKSRPRNYRKGERQKVYPIKRMEDIVGIANWLLLSSATKPELCRRNVLAFILDINLGLRANELLNLRLNEVFFPDGSVRYRDDLEDTTDALRIRQSKSKGKERVLFLNGACKAALEWCFPLRGPFMHCDGYLFPSREGDHIAVDTLRKLYKDAAKACGIRQNVGTHTGRKTWGWWEHRMDKELAAHGGGGDLTQLQQAFNHASQRETLCYLGISEEEDKSYYRRMCLEVIGDSRFGTELPALTGLE